MTVAAPSSCTVEVETADGARLAVTVSGAPDAPVTLVLLHGWTLATRSWRAQIAALRTALGDDRLRIVTYDHRGHGGSSRGRAPLSIRLLARDLVTVLDTVVPEGPIVLAGHSMGGMTIMALAGIRPDLFGNRVQGVALIDTAAGGLARPTLGLSGPVAVATRLVVRCVMAVMAHAPALANIVRRRLRVPSTTAAMAGREPPAVAGTRWLLFSPDAPADAVRDCAEQIDRTSTRSIGAFYSALRAHDEYASLAALGATRVHVVAGSLDRLTPLGHSRRMATSIPGATLTIVPDTGHLLLMERPGPVTDLLQALVAATAPEPTSGLEDQQVREASS